MVERKGAYRFLLGIPEQVGQLVRPRRRCEYNIKMNLQEVSWEGAWAGLIWLRTRTGGGLLKKR